MPGRYSTISDIDKKCKEITELYSGELIGNLAKKFGIQIVSKGLTENIVTAMFGGNSRK